MISPGLRCPGSSLGVGLVGCLLPILLVQGCSGPSAAHPAVGKRVGGVPLVSITDPTRSPPTFTGRVTLLNFWGTWCPPCRRELPGLARIAARLSDEARFQLVAVSCGAGGPDDLEEITADTTRFLSRERIAIEPWCDPRGMARMLFSEGYGFEAFPTTYLIGADGCIRRVWMGYRSRDEADISAAVVEVLKESPQPVAAEAAAAR
jgi:thiol-disulfide isomerase/thioredoxin